MKKEEFRAYDHQVIRWVIGQNDVQEKHIRNAWSLLLEKQEETLEQTKK